MQADQGEQGNFKAAQGQEDMLRSQPNQTDALVIELQEVVAVRQQRALVLQKSKQGEYEEAIALLHDLLSRYPDSAMDYNNRGLLYFQLEEYELALADFDVAIALNESLDQAYNNRANCYARLGQYAEAIADYQIALDFNPANLRAWINQGITYRELGLYDLALENFDITLILGKRLQGRAYGERGRTYHLRGDWNSAIADYQRAIEFLNNNLSARRYKKRVQQWLSELTNQSPIAN
ncbi:tetratricopeptide repeat protein [Spirulina sp. CS-785/01]|uniref:tetratricopeptide repeat protein n=1 Tax=Spirulina sp. CS-785/01 TaxID=3021716 RepID=UPI00232B3954|nr:tetratricopeptide repeat protein [Spirulina sp. CS-785/01]MDB9314841.1 tetratricopeptide repeat protein [Spirulina sp. CS-785/01]